MYRIYCDFDATLTVNDVGELFLNEFGGPGSIGVWEKLTRGEYTAAECIAEACASVKIHDEEALERMFALQSIREGFHEFYQLCNEKDIPIRLVSDGFSIYIDNILKRHKLDLPVHTNTIELQDNGTLSVELTNGREACVKCGACKCGAIITTSADEDTIVYIGDGYSDHCPVEIADVVFARDVLRNYCSANGIPYHPFEDFHTVGKILNMYLAERPKYKRSEAEKVRRKRIITE